MRSILLATVAVLALAAQAAQAAPTIYDWVPLSGSGNASGSLQIDQWDGNYFTWHLDWPIWHPSGGPYGGMQMNFEYYGYPQGVIHDPLYGDYDVSLYNDGYDQLLTGSIFVNNTGSALSMSSDNNGIWTITNANTDAGGPCGESSNSCAGDTGEWVLQGTPVHVPEPASALLLLAGAMPAMIRCRPRHVRM